MIEREIQDNDVRWHCVQAFTGGVTGELQTKATLGNDTVEVICTPSGGAQTVRFRAPADWAETMNDDELKQKIREG